MTEEDAYLNTSFNVDNLETCMQDIDKGSGYIFLTKLYSSLLYFISGFLHLLSPKAIIDKLESFFNLTWVV